MTTALTRLITRHSHLRSFPANRLLFSSVPDPHTQPPPIQPVSYAPKPKPDPDPQPTPAADPTLSERSPEPAGETSRPLRQARPARASWTREDIRYVKDAPSISPVSYPTKVAPLPEDMPVTGESGKGAEKGEEVKKGDGEVVKVTRRLRIFEREDREERMKVPFPTLLRQVKKELKPIYDLAEAIRLVKANVKSKFDETMEAHVVLGIEKKRSDMIVRGSLALPHGDGRKVAKIAFLGEGQDADEAREAGADIVGGVELVEKIASGGGKFDVKKCFTTPGFMPKVLKIAKILKPLGLLPNAKQGTLITDVSRAVKEAKQSSVDFKMDKTAIVHVGLGKVSLSEDCLRENVGAFMEALLRAKPAGLKKASKYAGYINSFHICSTMGPGYHVSIQSLSKAADHHSKAILG
ncbi:hypothetical protein MLD38_033305 [Melastoma candidum]|uniref:Uncharacterized protein n=1 Tax=Melastoma candidum TaxID=119954 RepID=A0ACB9MA21_9MYRT|nr:hypothetical protein MLD38_033305 [Melastoma candidum]